MNAGAIRAGRAFVELFADNTKLTRALRQSENQVKAFGNHLQDVGRNLIALGAASSLPFIASTKVFVGFSDQMKTVQAVTGATEKEFGRLNDTAKLLGRTTSYTAAQVAAAMVELGRAGFASGEINSMISDVLALARATSTELPQAASIASGTLRAFNMEASESTRVVDVLTATANNSAQTLTDLGEAMTYAAPIADEYGLSLEDTAKALGTLANFNIKGSMAGTSMRAMMVRLADPTVQKQLYKLGISAKDSKGNLQDFATILQKVGQATKNMGSGDRLAIFQKLFGRRAISGGAKLTAQGFDRLNAAIDNAAGTAKTTAKTMDDGLGGAMRRTWSAVEGVAIAVGESLEKALITVSDWLVRVLGSFVEWIDKNKQLVIVLGIIAATITGVGIALYGLGAAVKVFAFGIGLLSKIGLVLKGTFAFLTTIMSAMLTPMGLIAAATLALGGLFVLFSDRAGKAVTWLMQKFITLKTEFKAAWAEIGAALVAGDLSKAAEILWLTLKLQWAKGVYALRKIWENFKNFFINIGITAFTGLLFAADKMWEAFDVGVIETVNFFKQSWNTVGSFFAKLWERVKGDAQKAWNFIKGLFDKTFNVDIANQAIDAEVERAISKIDDEATRENAKLENEKRKKRDSSKAFHYEMMNMIADEYNGKKDDQASKHQQKLDENMQALAKARGEWQEAINLSKEARTKAEIEDGGEDAPGSSESKAIKALSFIAPAIKAAKGSVSGGFSGYGRFGMSGAAADRTAQATEAIARNTKDLLNEQRDNEGIIV